MFKLNVNTQEISLRLDICNEERLAGRADY